MSRPPKTLRFSAFALPYFVASGLAKIAVCRYDTYVGHHHVHVFLHGERVGGHTAKQLLRLLVEEHQRVLAHHKIEVLRVMVRMRKVERVLLCLRQRVCDNQRVSNLEARRRALAVATA